MLKSRLQFHGQHDLLFRCGNSILKKYTTTSCTTTTATSAISTTTLHNAARQFRRQEKEILNPYRKSRGSSSLSWISSFIPHVEQQQQQRSQHHHHTKCRAISTTAITENSSTQTSTPLSSSSSTTTILQEPTSQQLRRVFYRSALPMIGFGIMDQTVMLHAGHAIDCTIGVTFGLSTLTAAAFGQICSDASGVMFGTTLEQLASRVGLPRSGLTAEQLALPIVQRTKFIGALLGVISGCMIGLLNLLLIDTDKSSTLKLRALNEEQEFEFLVEASNAIRNDATALTVTGPDVDGILASMTAALALRGCSLVELHAKRNVSGLSISEIEEDKNSSIAPTSGIQDIFYVVDGKTGEPYDDDELHDLAQSLLDATRTPMNAIGIKAVIHELEKTNHYLKQRVHRLEQVVKEKQIRIIPKSSTLSSPDDNGNDSDDSYNVREQLKS